MLLKSSFLNPDGCKAVKKTLKMKARILANFGILILNWEKYEKKVKLCIL